MNPFSFSLNWLLLPLLLAWSAAVYWAGDHNRNNAWLAKQAEVEQQAHQKYVAEVERGQAASTKSTVEQQKLQRSYSLLEGKFNELAHRGPLVVYKTLPQGTDLLPGSPTGVSADRDISLSLGAVWMWNSALGGTDAPAGACGVVDTASEACAADSGIGLETAWDNHVTNAKSCAQDRLRHQQLIDFVSTRTNP